MICAVAAAFAAEARGERLDEAWAIALRVNQGLQSQQSQTTAAGFDSSAARAARMPTVRSLNYNIMFTNSPAAKTPFQAGAGGGGGGAGSGGGAGGAPRPGPGAGAGSGQTSPYYHFLGVNQNDLPLSFTLATLPLYTGGQLLRDIDAADQRVVQARAEEHRVALDLKLRVAEAYVEGLRAQRALAVAISTVEWLESFGRDVSNRRKQGLAIRSDELAAEVAMANAQLAEIQARTKLEQAAATYNRLLLRPLTTAVDLEELSSLPPEADWKSLARRAVKANAEFAELPEPEVSVMIDQAFRGRPELEELSAQARELNAQAESALSAIRPQISIGGGFSFIGAQRSAPQGNGIAIATVDWRLSDGGASRRKAAALRERERAAVQQRADLAAEIALEVRTRWLDLRQARLAIPIARYAVVQAEEDVKVVIDRYNQGLSTYTEVLDAVSRRIQSLTNSYNAIYDQSLASFRLHRAIGDL